MVRHIELMILRRVFDFLRRRERCLPGEISRLIGNGTVRCLSVAEIREHFSVLLRCAYLCDIIRMHERNVFRGVFEYVELAYREAERHSEGLAVDVRSLREEYERLRCKYIKK